MVVSGVQEPMPHADTKRALMEARCAATSSQDLVSLKNAYVACSSRCTATWLDVSGLNASFVCGIGEVSIHLRKYFTITCERRRFMRERGSEGGEFIPPLYGVT